jgi:50S ribosomal protein L16 3-hydroxylase
MRFTLVKELGALAVIIGSVIRSLLGGLSTSAFLRKHWQKSPLLVRGAIPRFEGFAGLSSLIALAAREDCESRLVIQHSGNWHVEHGPFARSRWRRLPRGRWTLLVQGVNHFLRESRQLLAQFSFIPHARLDDLMVSFAPAGGGVGPHFDSYDVFLLQARGRRRWQVAWTPDRELVEDAPLRILKRFEPQGECVLAAGDMLYLPPGWAHDGVALEDCYTYSIGFRAPRHHEIVSEFLGYLDEATALDGIYSDPELRPARHPGSLDGKMLRKVESTLAALRWRRADVVTFLGRFLTAPKAHVHFSNPRPLSLAQFRRAARRQGIELTLASRLLYRGALAFINGECVATTASLRTAVMGLADHGSISGSRLPAAAAALDLLYRWYRSGYIRLGAGN